MHRLIILFVFMAIGCYAAELDKKECMKLFHPRSSRCCKSDPMKVIYKDGKDLKECFHEPKGPPPNHAHDELAPPPCDVEICIAEKKGFLNDDGTIDRDAVRASFEKDFADDPTLISKITEKCIEGDLDKYGPPDFCDLHKLKHCILLQSFGSCPEWDEESEGCSEIKELAGKCQN